MKLAVLVGAGCGLLLLLSVIYFTVALRRDSPFTGALLAALVLLVLSALCGQLAVKLLVAKGRAIEGRGRPVPLFWGLAHLVTWEQNEGVILLRDKRIAETIYGPRSGGGVRLVYNLLGEELRARVPLTVQLTWFRDERVLTREAIQLTVKVALWWQVSDLGAYFVQIDQEVHAIRDRDRPGEGYAAAAVPGARDKLSIAEVWVQTLAEACLRKLISDTSTFLIVSKQVAKGLHVEADSSTAATPDVIAHQLHADLAPRLGRYGLCLDRVEVQEVQLPPQIQRAVDDVWVASTLPQKSKYEATALQNRLEVLCSLLGREAAGVGEIVAKFPPGALFSNPLSVLPAILEQMAGVANATQPRGTLPQPVPTQPLPPRSGAG